MSNKRIKTTENTELHGGKIRKAGRKVVFHPLSDWLVEKGQGRNLWEKITVLGCFK